MRNALFILLSFFAFSCKKERCLQDNLSGKLKSIEFRDVSGKGYKLYYTYDISDGKLLKLSSDSLQYDITHFPDGNVSVSMKLTAENPDFNSNKYYVAAINGFNGISNIDDIDTVSGLNMPFMIMHYNDFSVVDTVAYAGVPEFVHDVKNYEYVRASDDYTQHTFSWKLKTLFGGVSSYSDTVLYEYTDYINSTSIPFQIPVLGTGFALSGIVLDNLLLHILDVNGYIFFNRNKHLIQSVTSVNRGYQTNYSYRFNAKNQISEMFISNPDATGIYMTYKFTYYE